MPASWGNRGISWRGNEVLMSGPYASYVARRSTPSRGCNAKSQIGNLTFMGVVSSSGCTFPSDLRRMKNRQGRGYNTAGNTHNPDAISATRRQIKRGSPSARCLATGSLALGSNNQAAGTVSPSRRL